MAKSKFKTARQDKTRTGSKKKKIGVRDLQNRVGKAIRSSPSSSKKKAAAKHLRKALTQDFGAKMTRAVESATGGLNVIYGGAESSRSKANKAAKTLRKSSDTIGGSDAAMKRIRKSSKSRSTTKRGPSNQEY